MLKAFYLQNGYRDLLKFADNFAAFNRRLKHAHFRPFVSVKSNPRAWWKYAYKAVSEELKKARYLTSLFSFTFSLPPFFFSHYFHTATKLLKEIEQFGCYTYEASHMLHGHECNVDFSNWLVMKIKL